MNRKIFDEMTESAQWQWVINNKEKINLIELDNDTTYVCADCFKEEGNEECSGYIAMKADIGNRWGIYHLLNALKIKNQGV